MKIQSIIKKSMIVLLLCPFQLAQPAHVLFSPDDKPASHIISLISKAQKKIYCALYIFTHKKIAHALIEAKVRRNIDVQIVVDESCLSCPHHCIETLRKNGIDIFTYHSQQNGKYARSLMHHKFAIIDQTVLTGSFNWTYSASARNRENLNIITEKNFCLRYEEEFDQLKKECASRTQRHTNKKPQNKTTKSIYQGRSYRPFKPHRRLSYSAWV